MSFFIQMGSLGQMWRLVEQVSLVQEGVSPQWAHSTVTQNGLRGRLTDTIHAQTDGGSCHDGGLEAQTHTAEMKLLLRRLQVRTKDGDEC